MILFFVFFISLSVCALILVSRTRRYQLGQLAKHLNMQFDNYRESVTTIQTVGQLEFFRQFFHQYRNVFTSSAAAAFIRISDDAIFVDDKPSTKPQLFTIFTAELKRRQFPTFKIAPVGSLFAKSNYPQIKINTPEIDKSYCVYTPQQGNNTFLTNALLSLLKKHNDIYLEVNDNALVYHESCLVAPEDIPTFRLRALQLLQECEQILTNLQNNIPGENTLRMATAQSPKTEIDRAEALMAALTSSQTPDIPQGPKNWIGTSIVIVVVAAVGLFLISWMLLKNLPH